MTLIANTQNYMDYDVSENSENNRTENHRGGEAADLTTKRNLDSYKGVAASWRLVAASAHLPR